MFQEEPISVGYFVACLVFLILPSLFCMIFMVKPGFGTTTCEIYDIKRRLITGVMMITLPLQTTILSGANLIFGDENVVAKKFKEEQSEGWKVEDMETLNMLKLFEIVGRIFWANYFRDFDW